VLLINHPNRRVLKTINNFDNIPIGLCVISHESLEIGFWKPILQQCFIKLCPHKSLNFNVFKLHITNNYGQHFTIDMIVHMTSHSCPPNNTLHMIKHDLNILQIWRTPNSLKDSNVSPSRKQQKKEESEHAP